MSECYFCNETERLEKHHIIPRRFSGSDAAENLVQVCPTCHSKLEHLYDARFYSHIGVRQNDCTDKKLFEIAKGAVKKYDKKSKQYPDSTFKPWVESYKWINNQINSNLALCVSCGFIIEPIEGVCPKCNGEIHE